MISIIQLDDQIEQRYESTRSAQMHVQIRGKNYERSSQSRKNMEYSSLLDWIFNNYFVGCVRTSVRSFRGFKNMCVFFSIQI